MTLPPPRFGKPPRSRRAPEPPPYPEDFTGATRHLCAGAYLDDGFRELCLREVYYQPRRLVAPSYGCDVVPVLGHCLKARNASIARDAAIVVTFLIAACASWTSVLGVLVVLLGLQVVAATYRLGRDTFQKLRGDQPVNMGELGPRTALIGLGWLALSVLGSAVSGLFLSDLTGSLLTGGVDEATGTAGAAAFSSLALAGLLFAYPVAFSLWRQTELSRLAPGHRVTVPVSSPRLTEVARQQSGNTVVYSGFRPFVGSGRLVGTWGFAQRLIRPEPAGEAMNGDARRTAGAGVTEREREFDAPPFDAREVIDYVRHDLRALLPDGHGEARIAEEQIAGLTVEDRVHLAGTEVSRLTPNLEPDLINAVIRHPTTPARHYLVCQVFSWSGELITTVHVHIAVQGRSLYIELSTTALPPCADGYRIVDSVANQGATAWWRAVIGGVLDTPRTVGRSPLALTRSLINLVVSSAESPSADTPLARGFDYGARIGIRELGSQASMRNLVQLQDVEKYRRLIERRVIASILDFLDERGVDTTEYRTRAATALQIGTYNVNGNFNTVGGSTQFNAPIDARGSGGAA